jgi:hypothetical protein
MNSNKSKIVATGSLRRSIKFIAGIIVVIGIGGCAPGKMHETEACETETLRFYPIGSGDRFMIECMDSKGYEFDVASAECKSKTRMVMQSACYRRKGWVGRFFEIFTGPLYNPTKDVKEQ